MQQAGEVVRTSVDRYSDAFVKFIQSAFDNQDGKSHNSYATKFRLNSWYEFEVPTAYFTPNFVLQSFLMGQLI